jgi:hypothetical protein
MAKLTDEAAAVSSPRHVLPKDLPNAISHLGDDELERLFAAALAEMRRRGRRPPTDKPSQKSEPGAASLTRGQLNAVRAAFKAGVTPSRIARQFGLSQSDVRKALASEAFGPRGTD